jgi:hypothetical protein
MLQARQEARRQALEAAVARARAELKTRLLNKAQRDASKLEAGDLARDEEQILLASKIYLSLGLNRASEVRDEAKSRLDELRADGRKRLESVATTVNVSSPRIEDVFSAIEDYNWLEREFAEVPVVNREIQSAAGKARRRPEFRAALNEPEAAELFFLAQNHEKANQVCCAVLVYEQAAKLKPAPTAFKARQRLEQLKQDKEAVAAAEACRQLQWCHYSYEKAKRLAKHKPADARDLLAQILDKAPIDSEIYRAARFEIGRL